MAENKKSFLLYCDLIHTVTKMPVDKAGELFIHILKYVNDENPVTEDLITNLTFEPIKQSLKRDLEKWENTLEGRSRAGKASAEIKRQSKQNVTKSTSVEFVEQASTKSTDSVNDSVSVSVNDIFIKEKEEKITIQKTAGKFWDFKLIDAPQKILQDALETWSYATDTQMRKKITKEHIREKWKQFIATNNDSNQWYNNENEIYTHFKRWISKQKFKDANFTTTNIGKEIEFDRP